MSLPELVTIHTSLLTDLGDAVRERFGVSGDLTIPEMCAVINPPSPIPKEYQRVEYIEGGGNVGLDTGISVDGQNYARLTLMPQGQISSSNWGTMFGQNEKSKKACVIYSGSNTRIYWEYGGANTNSNTTPIINGAKYKFEIDNTVLKIINPDESTLATLGTAQTFTGATATFKILDSGNKGRIYDEILIGVTETIILYHGYPCYLKADPTQVGVYDTISRTFNTGTGSGSFGAGPDY